MKRILLFFIITLSAGKPILSQVTHSITIGPDLGVGGNFAKSSKVSIGGSFEYVAQVSSKIGIRLFGGYNRFNGKYYDDFVSFLPLRIGMQGFIYQDLIFIYAEGGVAHFKASTGTSKTGPSFSFGGGHRIPLNLARNQFIQLSVNFNYYKYKGDPPGGDLNYTWFNFRAAYGFSFGKKNKPKEE